MQTLHDSVPALASDSDPVLRARNGKAQRKWNMQPFQMAFAASVLVALIVPLLYYMGGEEAPEPKSFEAAVGERRTIDLDDGSVLTLNADSRISFVLSDEERQVTLHSGEIYVDVAADTDRPFHVDVGADRVSAIGTAFDVRYRDEPARVTVIEGRVRVAPNTDASTINTVYDLDTGQRLVLEFGAEPTILSQDELKLASDWRNGWLHFNNDSLASVAKALDPHVDKRIVFADGEAANLKVGGSFNVDRLDSLWAALESVVPVEISEEGERIIIRHRP